MREDLERARSLIKSADDGYAYGDDLKLRTFNATLGIGYALLALHDKLEEMQRQANRFTEKRQCDAYGPTSYRCLQYEGHAGRHVGHDGVEWDTIT